MEKQSVIHCIYLPPEHMRTLLLIITTALLTTVGLFYAWQSDAFPAFFDLVMPTNSLQSQEAPPIDPNSKLISLEGNPCITPRNETVQHGEVFLSFAFPQATIADGGCISQSTICNNGTWSADQEPYGFSTCLIETPKTCDVNGFIFPNATTYTFYKPTTAGTCVSQERTCTDGEVDGDPTYLYISCPSSCPQIAESGTDIQPTPEEEAPTLWETNQAGTTTTPPPTVANTSKVQATVSTNRLSSLSQPNCPSPTGSYRREPGQEGFLYPSATAPYSTTCQEVSVVCAYGSIRYGTKESPGSIVTTDMSTTCSVADPLNCSSDCGEVDHGATITTYKQNILPHGNGQTCSDIRIVSTCSDGILSPAPGSACSCQIAPPAVCEAPNGVKIDHGLSLTLYKDKEVEASLWDGSDVCFRQRRQCVNGVRYDQGGNPNNFTYKYETCTVLPPSSSAAVLPDNTIVETTGSNETTGGTETGTTTN